MSAQPAVLYAPIWRALAVLSLALAGGGLLVVLTAVLLARDPPVTPPILLRLFGALVVVPATAAWVVRHACASTVTVDRGQIELRRRGLRIEIPRPSVASVKPWSVPLPGPGVALHLRSGRRFRYGLQVDDLPGLLSVLDGGAAAVHHPAVAYAAARGQVGRRRWYHRLGRYPLFALLPTAVLFNAHQYIAYGGTLGEYYLLGLRSYVSTFSVYWSTLTIYLLLYAGAWRMAAEGACLVGAWLSTPHATAIRRGAEAIVHISYYGGVPLLLALRFLPW